MSQGDTKTNIFIPIRAWLLTFINGIPVITWESNVPRPDGVYITLALTPLQKSGGRDYQEMDDNTGLVSICGQRTFSATITCYGEMVAKSKYNCFDIINQIADELDNPKTTELLTGSNLSVMSADAILDVSSLLESGFQPRAQIVLNMGTTTNRIVDLGTIDSVEVTPTYDGEEQDKIIIP